MGPSGPLEALVVLGAVQLLTMLAGLARTKILAVILGPAGLGITGVIDQIVAFTAHLGSLSIPFAALRYLSKHLGVDDEKLPSLYLAFYRALIAASLTGLVAALLFALWKMSVPGSDLGPYRVSVIIGLLSIPAIAIVALERNVLAVFDRSRMSASMAMAAGIALIGSSYAGIRIAGIAGLYVGNLVVYLALAVFLSVYVRDRLIPAPATRSLRQRTIPILRQERGLLRFCTLIHFLTLASPAAYLISRVLLLDYRGAEETGLMAAAFGFGVAIRTALSQANALYLTPLANRSTPATERSATVSHYARTLTVLFLFGVLPVVLFPAPFISLLYSPKFVAASVALGPFMISEGLLLVAGVYQSLLIGFDDLNGYTMCALIANAVTIIASFLLIPRFGVVGCALAFVIGNGILLVLTLARLMMSHSVSGLASDTTVFWIGMIALAAISLWVSRGAPGGLYLRIMIAVGGWCALLPLLSMTEIRAMLAPWKLKLAGGR